MIETPTPIDARGHRAGMLLGALTLLVLGACAVASGLSLNPPAPRPASAPAAEFSAERAFAHVRKIAQRPHAVGSAANAEVRRYLVGQLEAMGLRPEVRRATVGQPYVAGAAVARVRNIHARIPGSASTGHVVLVAHYDSHIGAPGAGDAASAVAAVLEIARALRAGPAPRNDVDIVFTDGEEQGLLGARAFVDAGVLDPQRSVVLNLDARGTCGQSLVLETSNESAHVVPAIARGGHPLATSFTEVVYRLASGNTDFTEFREAGYAGLNYIFTDCLVSYHTPLDTPANLSRSSLQHQGDSVLAATRYFAAADIPALHGGGRLTYFTVFGQLIWYPQALTPAIAAVAVAALIATLAYARRRGVRLRDVAAAAASFPVPLLAVAAAAVAWVFFVLESRYRVFATIYHTGLYTGGMLAVAVSVVAAWGLLLRRFRRTAEETALAVWVWLAALALVAAVLLPAAAYLLTLPLITGCLALLVALRLRAGPQWRAFACCAATVPAIVTMLPIIRLLRQAVPGFPLPMIAMALLLTMTLPVLYLLAPRRCAALVPGLAAVTALALLAGVGFAVPDPRHPWPVSLMYALEPDRGRAWWISTQDEPAPWVDRYVTAQRSDVGARFPRYGGGALHVGRAPAVDLPAPTITVTHDRREGDTRRVRLRLTSGGASRVALYADTTHHTVLEARVDGVEVGDAGARPASDAPWRWGFRFFGVPPEGVEVVLRVRGDRPLRLRALAYRTGLPQVSELTPRPDRLTWARYAANRTIVAQTVEI